METPVESRMSIVSETVAPGTVAVIKVPPTDPETGVTETSLGLIRKVASMRLWFFGIPYSK